MLSVVGLVVFATGYWTMADADTRGDRLAVVRAELTRLRRGGADSIRVYVSQTDVRVVFPRDTATQWGWSAQSEGYGPEYGWSADFKGIGGARQLELVLFRKHGGSQFFESFAELIKFDKPGFCRPNVTGMVRVPCRGRARASVVAGRLVLAAHDTTEIARTFGLRPNEVYVGEDGKAASGGHRRLAIPVDYVAPRIRVPDAAFRAAASKIDREYLARTENPYRYLRVAVENEAKLRLEYELATMREARSGRVPAGIGRFGDIQLNVGDSIGIGVFEGRCSTDSCSPDNELSWYATFSAVDSGVAAVRIAHPKPDTTGGKVIQMLREQSRQEIDSVLRHFALSPESPRQFVVAKHVGRTTLRARIGETPLDTLPWLGSIPQLIERDVVVVVGRGTAVPRKRR